MFVYFDNTDKLRAPDDAAVLICKLPGSLGNPHTSVSAITVGRGRFRHLPAISNGRRGGHDQEARMRKVVFSGVAALGFLTFGLTVFGHAGNFRQADAGGSGADVRVTRQNLVAMIDTSHGRPLLVAMMVR